MLEKFEADTYEAIKTKISLNPVLHSFQLTVNKFNLKHSHIDAFLNSMKMDLYDLQYNSDKFQEYIYGSAQVVGLMCLQVYTNGNEVDYNELEDSAVSLGSAFQKINFLRDLKNDINELGRSYFPNVDDGHLNDHAKADIISDIEKEFNDDLICILMLPN